jgi:hypothetical protein
LSWRPRRAARYCGSFALIRNGSGLVGGIAVLRDGRPPLTHEVCCCGAVSSQIIIWQKQALADGWRTSWVLSDARPLAKPLPDKHCSGAVIRVTLDDAVIAKLRAAA